MIVMVTLGIAPMVTLVPNVSKERMKVSSSCSSNKSAIAVRVKLMEVRGGNVLGRNVKNVLANSKSSPASEK